MSEDDEKKNLRGGRTSDHALNAQPPQGEAEYPPAPVLGTTAVAPAVGADAVPRIFAALAHRNYRIFFSGQVVSMIGTWMQITALGWLIYELTNSPLLLGAITASGQVPTWLFSLPAGAVADRVSKRRLLLFTQTVAMVLAFALAALSATPWIRAWHIAALSALGGTAFAFGMPAQQAFIAEMVPRSDLMNAIALNSGTFNLARLLGPAIAGALMAAFGVPLCFLINALTFIAVIVALTLIRVAEPEPTHGRPPVWREVLSGLRYVAGEARLLRALFTLGAVSIFTWAYVVLMPVFAKDVLKGDEVVLGWLMSASGGGALVGSLTVAYLGDYRRKFLLQNVGLAVFTVAVLVFAWSRSLPISLGAMAVGGWGAVVFLATLNTVLQMTTSHAMRGRVMALWSLIFMGTTPISSVLAGALAQRFGAPVTAMIGAGVGAVLAGLIAVGFARSSRKAQC